MKNNRLLALAITIAVLVGIGYTVKGKPSHPAPAAAQEKSAAIPVRTAAVAKRDIRSTLDYSGTVAPARVVTLAPKVTGQITSISVTEGDIVRAGDPLVSINDEQLQTAMVRLEAKVEQAQLNLDQQQLEFNRMAELYEAAAISQQQYDKAQFGLNLAAATLKEAHATLAEAMLNLTNTKIAAPDGGVILQLMAEPGDLATMGKPLLVLSTGHDLVVETQVIEEDLAHINVGMTTKVRFPGDDQAYASTITQIDPSLDPKSRSARVKIAVLKDAPPKVMPGMSADITLVLAEFRDTLSVPIQALVQDSGTETGVYIVSGDEAKWQPINPGISDNTYVQVVDGLTAGEAVVVEGKEKLYNNAPVFIFNDQEEKESEHE